MKNETDYGAAIDELVKGVLEVSRGYETTIKYLSPEAAEMREEWLKASNSVEHIAFVVLASSGAIAMQKPLRTGCSIYLINMDELRNQLSGCSRDFIEKVFLPACSRVVKLKNPNLMDYSVSFVEEFGRTFLRVAKEETSDQARNLAFKEDHNGDDDSDKGENEYTKAQEEFWKDVVDLRVDPSDELGSIRKPGPLSVEKYREEKYKEMRDQVMAGMSDQNYESRGPKPQPTMMLDKTKNQQSAAQKAADKAANDLLDRSLEMKKTPEAEAQKNANASIYGTRADIAALADAIMDCRSALTSKAVLGIISVGKEIVDEIIREFFEMDDGSTSTLAVVYDIWEGINYRWKLQDGQDISSAVCDLIPAIADCVCRLTHSGKMTYKLPAVFEKGSKIGFTLFKNYRTEQKAWETQPELSADTRAIVDAIDGLRTTLSLVGQLIPKPFNSMPKFMQPGMPFPRPGNPSDPYFSGQPGPAPFFGPYGMTPPPYPFGNNPQQQETFYPRSHDRFQPNRFDKMSDNYQLIKVVVQAILDRINVCGPESFFMSKIVSSIVPGGIDVCELDDKAWKKILEGVGRFHDGVYKLDVRPATTTSGIRGVEIHIS